METIVAIILIFIMILFDTRSVGKIINIVKPTDTGLKNLVKPVSAELFNTRSSSFDPTTVISTFAKSNLWIFNNKTESSLINLCIKSIIKHSNNLYNILLTVSYGKYASL